MKGTYTFWGALVFVIFNTLICDAQQTVGLFKKSSGSQDGFVLFSSESSYKTYLIDKCGKKVHEWTTNTYPALHNSLLPNGNLLSSGIVNNNWFKTGGSSGGLLQIFDWDGKLLWRYKISDSIATQNHDLYPMPNGNILVLEWERFSSKMAVAAGKDSSQVKGYDIIGVKVQEIKPLGVDSATVVWQWRIWDHLVQEHDSTKRNFGSVAKHPELLDINYYDSSITGFGSSVTDWVHANAVTYNAKLDQVMVSSRSLSEVWIIDHSTTIAEAASHSGGKHNKGGDFLYRWGNPQVYKRGTDKDRKLFVQHNPSWIADDLKGAGTISVFNNGTGRPAGDYTSAEAFSPPVSSGGDYYLAPGKAYGPDSSYWTYTAPTPTDFYSPFQGGLQRLPNGNTLICEAAKGNFFEVDSGNNVVWKYVNPDIGILLAQKVTPVNNIVFRAHLYPLNYSAFSNKDLQPGLPLEQSPFPYLCYMPYPFIVKPLYSVSQLKKINLYGVADSLNAGTGFIKGVVQSPDIGDSGMQFSMYDKTGNISVSFNKNYYAPAIGDSVIVHGTVTQSNGLIVYSADTVILKSKGTVMNYPRVVSQLSEFFESDLLTLKNVTMVSKSDWNPTGNGFDVRISNGKDTFIMYVSSKTDLFKMSVPWEHFNITGIEIQNKALSPYFGGYKIVPRGSFDIQKAKAQYFIWQVKHQNPYNGISDSAGSQYPFYLKGIVQSPNLTKKGYCFSIKDITGAIFIFSDSTPGNYTPVIGDSILVKGVVVQNNGVTGVKIDSLSILDNASPVLSPIFVYYLNEYTEANLVKYTKAWLTDPGQWAPAGEGFPVDITNGYDTIQLYISNASDVYSRPAPLGKFNITGIGWQHKTYPPYYGGYQLIPRNFDDFRFLPVKLYHICDVKSYNLKSGIADSLHTRCYIKGIVQSPNLTYPGYYFSIKDSTGAIFIYSDSTAGKYTPVPGDSILVRGDVVQKNGTTGLKIDSISKLKNSAIVLHPEYGAELNENNESHLVKYTNARLLNPVQWARAGDGFPVDITNGSDTIQLYISKTTDVYNSPAPMRKFNVSGIVSQHKLSPPYYGGYQLMPRSIDDFFYMPLPVLNIRDVKGINPVSGIADSLGKWCFLKGTVQSPDLSGKNNGLFSFQDSTGSIMVTPDNVLNGYNPETGDNIIVRGMVSQIHGLTTIIVDSVSKLQSGQPKSPVVVTGLDESAESELVTLRKYKLLDLSQWDTTGAAEYFRVQAAGDNDTITLSIIRGTELYSNITAPPDSFDVTGIVFQDDSLSPYFTGYYLVPRFNFDIIRLENDRSVVRDIKIGNQKLDVFPNPASGSITISATFCVNKIEISDMLGNTVIQQRPGSVFSTIDIGSLPEGFYFIKVYHGTEFEIRKIFKN